ncbi:superoxide dismutase [Candidatus Parcubacteria bacterium]|nr:MAG: superoxide dismutase [Candidatus Parcubacteria bacterium]
MEHTLYKLPYSFDALEPHIDAQTMEIHYTKHHQAYLDNFKKVVEKNPNLKDLSAEDILRDLKKLDVSEEDRKALQNHGGGFVNHNLYWSVMGPEKQIDETLVSDIEKTFGSLDSFKELFNLTATKQFGSGWAWLVRDKNQDLKVYSLPNQDSPLSLGHEPILAIDVWEHAYYLKYQNKRVEYIENWWNVVKIV